MMDEKDRDIYLLEILDRLARLETKFDEQVDLKVLTREALDRSNDNSRAIADLSRRLGDHDDKWKTDRSEKWGMWLAIIGGFFAVTAALLSKIL